MFITCWTPSHTVRDKFTQYKHLWFSDVKYDMWKQFHMEYHLWHQMYFHMGLVRHFVCSSVTPSSRSQKAEAANLLLQLCAQMTVWMLLLRCGRESDADDWQRGIWPTCRGLLCHISALRTWPLSLCLENNLKKPKWSIGKLHSMRQLEQHSSCCFCFKERRAEGKNDWILKFASN